MVAPTGCAPLPRYYVTRFTIQRVRTKLIPRPETLERTILRDRAQQLRKQGMSYPQIAKALGISVGSAWNMANAQRIR
jgi:hypothetical protein